MKGRGQKQYLPKKRILFYIIFSVLLSTIGENKTVYAADAEVRDVNLNQQGRIAGLAGPKQPAMADSDWAGVYLYFGEYQQGWPSGEEPVKWRVLDAATTEYGERDEPTILLLSDKVVAKAEFNKNPDLADDGGGTALKGLHQANEYAYSKIREWLNSEKCEANEEEKYFKEGFYEGAFSSGEQNAIAVSVKKAGGQISGYGDNSGLSQKGTQDKVFLLGANEALNPLYGFFPNVHVKMARSGMLEVTSYAGKHGVEEESGVGAWWLRSAIPNSGSIVYYVNDRGRIETADAEGGLGIGVAPAINLKLSSVAFTYQTGKSKDAAFGMTSAAGQNNKWELALWGGKGFVASWAGEAKREVLLRIDAVGMPDEGVEYTQLSAMLVDGEGTVLSCGRIGEKAETGEVGIKIPEEIRTGTYGLKVFAEDVNGEGYTDFVSNMAEFTVQVLETGNVKGTPTRVPTPTLAPALVSTPILALTPTPPPKETLPPSKENDEKDQGTEKETSQNSGKIVAIAVLILLSAVAVGCGGAIAGIHWFHKKN